jgi:hypothetical protein
MKLEYVGPDHSKDRGDAPLSAVEEAIGVQPPVPQAARFSTDDPNEIKRAGELLDAGEGEVQELAAAWRGGQQGDLVVPGPLVPDVVAALSDEFPNLEA